MPLCVKVSEFCQTQGGTQGKTQSALTASIPIPFEIQKGSSTFLLKKENTNKRWSLKSLFFFFIFFFQKPASQASGRCFEAMQAFSTTSQLFRQNVFPISASPILSPSSLLFLPDFDSFTGFFFFVVFWFPLYYSLLARVVVVCSVLSALRSWR